MKEKDYPKEGKEEVSRKRYPKKRPTSGAMQWVMWEASRRRRLFDGDVERERKWVGWGMCFWIREP